MINTVSTKIVNLQQGTTEWLKWRESGVGGSDIGSILGVSPYKTKYQLWLEKTGAVEPEDLSLNFAVQRGHALEDEARQLISNDLKDEFPAKCFESEEFSFLKFSCDGFSFRTNTMIEIKCPGIKNHLLTMTEGIPKNYLYQIQYGLMLTKAEKCYYVSYNLESDNKAIILEVIPDLKIQDEIFKAASNFWHNVKTNTPPELTNKDKTEIETDQFRELSQKYRQAKSDLSKAEEDFKIIEDQVKSYAKENSILNATGFGVNIQLINKKGSIDYDKIDVLKEIDLEKYRKNGSSYYKITVR